MQEVKMLQDALTMLDKLPVWQAKSMRQELLLQQQRIEQLEQENKALTIAYNVMRK
jgi:hypothetical protein